MCLKKFFLIIVLSSVFFLLSNISYSATQTQSHTYQDALYWAYNDQPIPNTYWSYYIPLAHMIYRFKIGIRFSPPRIVLKDSVKVDFIWDDNDAKGGKTLKLKIKPTLTDESYNTFESSFGFYLPNIIELGFVGIEGLPDILPWFTLDYDLWDLLKFVPKYGDYISSFMDQIGVNMASKKGLPLGKMKEYHDTRELFSLSLADIVKKTGAGKYVKNEAIVGLWNKIPYSLKVTAINIVKSLKKVDEAGATDFLQDLIGSGLEQVAGIGKFSLIGDPLFAVNGRSLVLLVKYWVPGKMEGVYPVEFTSSDQEFELPIRLPIYIEDGDKLYVSIENITYNFTLFQKLLFKIGFGSIPGIGNIEEVEVPATAVVGAGGLAVATLIKSVFGVDLLDTTKTVASPQVIKDYGADEFRLEIPILKNQEAIQGLTAYPGVTSCAVRWESPYILLKGTVKCFKGNQLIAEKTESDFYKSHYVNFINLEPDTEYSFKVTCVDNNGNTYPEMTISKKTNQRLTYAYQTDDSIDLVSPVEYPDGTVINSVHLTSPQVTAEQNSITFSWNTDVPAGTQVFLGESADVHQDYLAFTKKTSGIVERGAFGQTSADMELVKNHSLTATGLEPGTTYYYIINSWVFAKERSNKRHLIVDSKSQATLDLVRLTYLGTANTQPAPPPPSVIIQTKDSSGRPLGNIGLIITKSGETQEQFFTTGADGQTSQIILEKGTNYNVSVRNNPIFLDKVININVPSNQQGPLPNQILTLTHRASRGGYVYDIVGNPLNQAMVKLYQGSSQIGTTTTTADGHYTFEGLNPGNYRVEISKQGYVTQTIDAVVDVLGFFSASGVNLSFSPAQLNILVKINQSPTANVALSVKNLSTAELWNLNTDTQGRANLNINFDSVLASYFEVVVLASETLKINEKRIDGITLVPAEVKNLEINCSLDNEVSASVQAINVRQDSVGNLGIDIQVKRDEPVQVQLVYFEPSGNQVELPWTLYPSAGTSSFAISNASVGTYRIKARLKDNVGNTSESDFKDFVVFKNESLGLKVTDVTSTSAKLHWNPYPRDTDFGKYRITCHDNKNNPLSPIEITDRNTSSYLLTGLKPHSYHSATPHSCGLSVCNKNGETIVSAGVNFHTLIPEPTIENFSILPSFAGLGEEINISAKITNPGDYARRILLYLDNSKGKTPFYSSYENEINTKIVASEAGKQRIRMIVENVDLPGKIEEIREFTVSEYEIPKIDKDKIPEQIYINTPTEFSFRFLNFNKAGEKFLYAVDWGDGKKDSRPLELKMTKSRSGSGEKELQATFKLEHTYATEGSFNLNLIVKSLLKGDSSLQSEPLVLPIQVIVLSPLIEFSRVASDLASQNFYVKAKAQSGSFAVKNWEIIFGDGKKENGEGEVDKNILHTYFQKGDYAAKFIVVDTKDTTYTKEVVFRVRQSASETEDLGLISPQPVPAGRIPSSDLSQRLSAQSSKTAPAQSQEKQETKPQDLSLEKMDLPPDIFVGEKVNVIILVKNLSESLAEKVNLILETEDGFRDRKEISLKPKGQEKINFIWTPKQFGRQRITASLDYEDDTNPKNNQITQRIEVKSKEEEKKEEVSINIIRMMLEGERQEILPAGSPLIVILELESSADFKEHLEANISLKGREFQKDFTEKIPKLQKGRNKIQWELFREIRPDKYNLSVELINLEYKIRLRQEKNFVVLAEGK